VSDGRLAGHGSELPRQGEHLFKHGEDDREDPLNWRFNAFVGCRPDCITGWLRYIEGYRSAGEAVLKAVVQDRLKVDTLVFPLVFLYR
jgi:hypothetical protein